VALEKVRKELHRRGLRLILDFVPNHVAIDHPWISTNPEYFIQGDANDLERKPDEFFQSEDGVFAYGRDPFFPAWQDVAQLNAFSTGYRNAAILELKKIGRICDGVRCDMAMLLLNNIFAKSWQSRVSAIPEIEFWQEIISSVKSAHSSMMFFAEVYWGLEWELMQLGFDYCYDKRLYDRLVHENAATIRLHLEGNIDFQKHLLRFLENHDEPRIASAMSIHQQKAAAMIAFSLPGASLLYEGQWDGRHRKNHVLLGRREPERVMKDLVEFYKNLLPAIKKIHDNGIWELCNVSGWLNNNTCDNLLPFTWQAGPNKDLIIVNYSDTQAQGRVLLPWKELKDLDVKLIDNLEQNTLVRSGSELKHKGLFVDLPPWGFHFFTTYLR
jgi:glycosidase